MGISMKMPFSFKTLQMICIYRDHGKVYCNAEKSPLRSNRCGQSHCEIWSKFKRVLEKDESLPTIEKSVI